MNNSKSQELARFNLEKGQHTGVVMASLSRKGNDGTSRRSASPLTAALRTTSSTWLFRRYARRPWYLAVMRRLPPANCVWTSVIRRLQAQTSISLHSPNHLGKVRGDGDMCFYGQTSILGGAVQLTANSAGRAEFTVDLSRVDPAVEKVALTATIYENKATFDRVSAIAAALTGGIEAQIPTHGMNETALIGEFYFGRERGSFVVSPRASREAWDRWQSTSASKSLHLLPRRHRLPLRRLKYLQPRRSRPSASAGNARQVSLEHQPGQACCRVW